MPEPHWSGELIDLDAYLDRIGYAGPLDTSAKTLAALHRAHAETIPFENLDVVLGRTPQLDIPALQEKLIRNARGGYCYEHNTLFAALLERLGFPVTGLTARVQLSRKDKVIAPNHAAVRVEADGRSWLADVGFGNEGLIAPVCLDEFTVQKQYAWAHRLVATNTADIILQTLHPDGWSDLYSFTPQPAYPVDYTVPNHYMATHPNSPFYSRVFLQRVEPDQRHTLDGRELVTTKPDGGETRRKITNKEFGPTLREVFGIELDAADLAALT